MLLALAACGGSEMPPSQGMTATGAAASGGTGTPTTGGTTANAAGMTATSAGRTSAGSAAGRAATSGGGASGTAANGGSTASGSGAAGMQEPAMAGMAASTAGSGEPSSGGNESACLDGITKYDEQGPFMFMPNTMGQVKIWAPMVPAGCKVPILHLANGTGASCMNYQPILERFASHGFLTTCYENANTGAGTQGVMAFETAMKAYPDLFVKKLGSTGHSQGGQAAFMVLVLSEQKWGQTDFKYAGLAMEPASGFGTQPSGGSWQSWYGKIKSPMLAFSGTADMLVPQAWVQQGYDALSDDIEAYHWSAVGATHIPTPDEHTMQIGVAWWRWKLLGDQAACEWFKKLPDGDQWNKVREQNVPPC
ncbi:MAG TPA: hypothetical protein VJV78_23570 [Polyangiales bacterium]|nr:hypothetical protein [Polyangiales bacterium]